MFGTLYVKTEAKILQKLELFKWLPVTENVEQLMLLTEPDQSEVAPQAKYKLRHSTFFSLTLN